MKPLPDLSFIWLAQTLSKTALASIWLKANHILPKLKWMKARFTVSVSPSVTKAAMIGFRGR
jgi:hypothetical protein